MGTLVMKFGGTSVGSAMAIQQVIKIVQAEVQNWDHLMVVTSAMSGVTDSLVQLVNSAIQHDTQTIDEQLGILRNRHQEIARVFIDEAENPALIEKVDAQIEELLDQLKATCQAIITQGKANGRLRDALLSMGERFMARVLSAILQGSDISATPIDASDILVTNNRHQNAQPIFDLSQKNVTKIIHPLLENNRVPVVTGYIGATIDGDITTLGRGGSDYSATYLARLLDADEVWIWTDVNGVMSADPRKIKKAQVMASISYEAVSEFAHFGAKVLHPRAVEPLIEPQIPLRVCNTFDSEVDGTQIIGELAHAPKHLTAVTSIDGVLVFIPSNQLNAANEKQSLFDTVQEVLIEQFSQDVQPVITVDSHTGRLLCYVVPTTARRTAMDESVAALTEIFNEIHQDNWRVEPITIVAAIGVVDVQQTVHVLNAVKSVKADLLAMGQGSPQCCLLAVPPQQALRVMRRLHRMILSVQSQLPYVEDNSPLPISSVPSNRKGKGKRRGRPTDPPQRVIPF